MKKVRIIAEAGVNHNGSIDLAKNLVRVAASAGADIVKFQTFNASELIAAGAQKAAYQEKNTAAGDQLEMVKGLQLSLDDHHTLAGLAAMLGITFLSTPFDHGSVDMLEAFNMPFYKIPSGELTNAPLLKYIASKGKPVVMSTGMAEMEEIRAALDILESSGLQHKDITLLKCTTDYPTPYSDAQLLGMLTLKEKFDTPVGYSDHTSGIEVPIAATALGAQVIEKHITLDRALPGPDHAASIEPAELAQMVRSIRNIEKALGNGAISPTPTEIQNRTVARKSIHTAHLIEGGKILGSEDLVMKRPGDGISPMELDKVLGKKAAKDLGTEHKLSWEDLE